MKVSLFSVTEEQQQRAKELLGQFTQAVEQSDSHGTYFTGDIKPDDEAACQRAIFESRIPFKITL